jgi:hypothetical protein
MFSKIKEKALEIAKTNKETIDHFKLAEATSKSGQSNENGQIGKDTTKNFSDAAAASVRSVSSNKIILGTGALTFLVSGAAAGLAITGIGFVAKKASEEAIRRLFDDKIKTPSQKQEDAKKEFWEKHGSGIPQLSDYILAVKDMTVDSVEKLVNFNGFKPLVKSNTESNQSDDVKAEQKVRV